MQIASVWDLGKAPRWEYIIFYGDKDSRGCRSAIQVGRQRVASKPRKTMMTHGTEGVGKVTKADWHGLPVSVKRAVERELM